MSRFSGGLVVGKFAPLHRGHERLIEAALAQCGRVVVMVWSDPDFEAMPTAVRAAWLRERFPGAAVLAFDVGEAPANAAPDDEHRAFIRSRLPFPVEAVFTGGEAYGEGLARALGAVHVAVDRRADGLSGAAARADPRGYHAHVLPVARAHFVERVVFLGAESSGKTTLARAVAARLGEPWVEEVGRAVWEERGGSLGPDDHVRICRAHVAEEDTAARRARRWVVVDTNALTTQLYAFFLLGTCPPEVQAHAARCRARYRHVFVCAPDFPFVQDGTRVHSQVQRYMDGAVRHDLTVRGIPYTVVEGPVEKRVERVLAALGAG